MPAGLHDEVFSTPAKLCALVAGAERITRQRARELRAEVRRTAGVQVHESRGVLLMVGWDLVHNCNALRAFIIEKRTT